MIIRRLRLADRETMAIETLHVRESLVPGSRAGRPRAAVVLRAAPGALRHRDRRRHPDDRADGDERGGVGGARRAAPLAGVPVRAHDALGRRRDRRVRALDLPRRPLPARHRAQPRAPRARSGNGRRDPRRALVSTNSAVQAGTAGHRDRRRSPSSRWKHAESTPSASPVRRESGLDKPAVVCQSSDPWPSGINQ